MALLGIYRAGIAVEKLWECWIVSWLWRKSRPCIGVIVVDETPGLGCTLGFCMTAMSKRTRESGPGKPKSDICTVLRKYLRQGTNLGVAIPVLSAHIDATRSGKRPAGLTEKQIRAKFRELSAKFFNSEYHPTYLHRAVGRFLTASEGPAAALVLRRLGPLTPRADVAAASAAALCGGCPCGCRGYRAGSSSWK